MTSYRFLSYPCNENDSAERRKKLELKLLRRLLWKGRKGKKKKITTEEGFTPLPGLNVELLLRILLKFSSVNLFQVVL